MSMFIRAAGFVHDHNPIPALKAANRVMRRITGWGYKLQLQAEWHSGTHADWYDHLIFQHWL
jgi:hypothetical protein